MKVLQKTAYQADDALGVLFLEHPSENVLIVDRRMILKSDSGETLFLISRSGFSPLWRTGDTNATGKKATIYQ